MEGRVRSKNNTSAWPIRDMLFSDFFEMFGDDEQIMATSSDYVRLSDGITYGKFERFKFF